MYKLLLVDDEPLIRNGIKKLIDLKALSISEVYEASDGEEALLAVKKHKPDIILLDINIPILDGLTIAKKLKEENQMIKIAIITGYDYFDYAVTAIKAGVDDFVLKPVSKSDISEILIKLVKKLDKELSVNKAYKVIENIEGMSGDNDETYKTEIQKEIENGYTDSSFSLAKLANNVNLSTGYLSTLFKRIFGIPFQEYLLNIRLEKSKILLLSTDKKVYEISHIVGFDDQNYFSTIFKKKYNVSPNKYRNNIN